MQKQNTRIYALNKIVELQVYNYSLDITSYLFFHLKCE